MTESQRETLLRLVGNALDQDHDSLDGSYLWFLTDMDSEPGLPDDQDAIDAVRDDLQAIHDSLFAMVPAALTRDARIVHSFTVDILPDPEHGPVNLETTDPSIALGVNGARVATFTWTEADAVGDALRTVTGIARNG